jgi:hypothetical protein
MTTKTSVFSIKEKQWENKTGNASITLILRRVRATTVALEKFYVMSTFVALVSSTRLNHIVTCGLSSSTTFSTLYHKWCDFRKRKFIEHKMCVLIFSTTFFVKHFSVIRRTERDMIKNLYRSSCKEPVILVIF